MSHIKHFFAYWSKERETSGDIILAVPQSGTYSLLDESLGHAAVGSSSSSTSQFLCHWFIAAPFSGVLAGKRPAGDGAATSLSTPEMIVVDGAAPEDVKCLVDFFYGAPLPTSNVVDFARMKRMRRLADQLDVPLLRTACRNWLRQNVDLRRAWGILDEALLDDDDVTVQKCVHLLQTVPDVFFLDANQMRDISHQAVLEVVKQPSLPVPEDQLFSFVEAFLSAKREAVLVGANDANDANYAQEILNHIRFPTLSPEFFFSKVSRAKWVNEW